MTEPSDDFAGRRLKRVRDQLDRLDGIAAEETDPKRIKELADATTRLSEQERVLAGRPLPGSRRPAAEGKRGYRPESAGPMVPVAPSAPAVPAAPVAQESCCAPATPTVEPEKLPGDVTP
jgi:hypothetical protein